jgi:predicted RNA-binding protein associated with RNAse of E/G family
MTDTLTVYKLDHHGREVWRYPARVLARGDRLVETFYSDRWYNVFAVYNRDDGALKGWYCNVTRPATITDVLVSSDDLALDVWVSPDGAVTILDEDEFEALALNDGERKAARGALAQIIELAQSSRLPV